MEPEAGKSACRALESERGFSRARVESALADDVLRVSIDADDVVALRAAMNGVLRNLQVFESIEENIE